MTHSPTPTAAHRALEVLAGKWITQGTIRGGAGEPPSSMRAIDTYEWLPGEFFLLHRVDAVMGGAVARSIEIIGYDTERGCYVTRSYDDQGGTEEFTARLTGQSWAIDGEQVRFRGSFSAGGSVLAGTWERRGNDGMWERWMEIELQKLA